MSMAKIYESQYNDMQFRWVVTVSGRLGSNYEFTSFEDVNKWMNSSFVELEKEYGQLHVNISTTDGLVVGDECHVYGDGNDVYEIVGIVKYSEDRYGFVLDAGHTEEVSKCFKVRRPFY